jgi:hypothetical protein
MMIVPIVLSFPRRDAAATHLVHFDKAQFDDFMSGGHGDLLFWRREESLRIVTQHGISKTLCDTGHDL